MDLCVCLRLHVLEIFPSISLSFSTCVNVYARLCLCMYPEQWVTYVISVWSFRGGLMPVYSLDASVAIYLFFPPISDFPKKKDDG